ncbi:hypothetical protein ASE63_22515 [Bosea sp. Root381]|uniref:Pam3-gp28 family putative phage holin n=1 Tax=Bosea sp. Root381 TaxID=1736524 RepID=UPI0007133BB2|nr:hypothetical protein [Bosea sp. Root381]KRE07476.1 hypothetical protein ASE63_22515 [Bosea sp. Root381]
MLSWIDWPVLTRQLLLVVVPVLVAKGWLPDYLADPMVEAATYIIGTLLVGWVIWLGQRREQPAAKIEEVAQLPEVAKVEVKSEKLAQAIPSAKVVA